MAQTQIIDIGEASLECTVKGSGDPLVVLANAGCSTGYLERFGERLSRSQIIAINMRGVGASRGPLDNATLHDLASDVAGVLEALQCGPVHVLGHAFGNRIARCLAADHPPMVRGVILVAAGGLIGPSTPLGSSFRDAPPTKLTGPECVALGARWLSPASDPSILTSVECWPQVHIAHLATSQGVPRDEWWTGGKAPLLVIQGLDDIVAPPGNGHALREQLGERVQVVDIPRAGHFVIVEQPDPVAAAVTDFIGGKRVSPHYRPQEAGMTNNDDDFVEKFLAPWNRHDVDGALSLMTDDCIWEITRGAEAHGTLYSGSSEVRTAIDDAFKAVPNIHYEPLRCHYGKDHVVVELLVTGTRVDGEELRFHACDILTLAGYKIAGKRSYRKVLA
jgi:pimeloyl-ACP methyl ester carboxylesterase/ketosteroid isomerase-like protein